MGFGKVFIGAGCKLHGLCVPDVSDTVKGATGYIVYSSDFQVKTILILLHAVPSYPVSETSGVRQKWVNSPVVRRARKKPC